MSEAQVFFEIPGAPVAKGRPRISARGGFARAYTPKKTVNFEARVALAAQQAMEGRERFEGPVAMVLSVRLPIPPSWSKTKQNQALSGGVQPCSRPDIDNYVKAVFDGCNEVVWRDDSQVVSLIAIKEYSDVPSIRVGVEAA